MAATRAQLMIERTAHYTDGVIATYFYGPYPAEVASEVIADMQAMDKAWNAHSLNTVHTIYRLAQGDPQ